MTNHEFEMEEPLNGCSATLSQDIFKMSREEMRKEVFGVTQSAISVAIGIMLSILFLSINMHFAGHLEDSAILSGLGLGNVMINCMGYFLIVGLNQGFGSMSAQAFSSNSLNLQKNYFSKGLLTTLFVSIFLFIFLQFLEPILLSLGQLPEVSAYASEYTNGVVFGVICLFFFDLIRNHFNAMGIYTEPMQIQCVAIITQYIFGRIFCVELGLGLKGIIIGTNLNYFLLLVAAIVYARKKGIDITPEKSWHVVMLNYKRYLGYCMPFALPLVIDTFGFELNSILIGSMQIPKQFSAHVIMCNLASLVFSLPLGLCGALSTMISNAVGYNDYVKARNYWKISYIVGCAFGICGTIAFVFFKLEIGSLYTSDEEIIEHFLSVMRIFSCFLFFDYLQCSQAGVLKGVGKGKLCLYLFIVSFYLVGTTFSVLLGFTFDMQLIGFWIGLAMGITSIFVLQTIAMWRIEWPQQILKQHEQLLNDKKLLDDLSSSIKNNI